MLHSSFPTDGAPATADPVTAATTTATAAAAAAAAALAARDLNTEIGVDLVIADVDGDADADVAGECDSSASSACLGGASRVPSFFDVPPPCDLPDRYFLTQY